MYELLSTQVYYEQSLHKGRVLQKMLKLHKHVKMLLQKKKHACCSTNLQ